MCLLFAAVAAPHRDACRTVDEAWLPENAIEVICQNAALVVVRKLAAGTMAIMARVFVYVRYIR